MMKHIQLTALCLLAVGCAGSPLAPQPMVLFELQVIDATTDRPIVGATVSTAQSSAVTDARGMAKLSVAEDEVFTVTFRAVGYEDRHEPYRLTQPTTSTTVTLIG